MAISQGNACFLRMELLLLIRSVSYTHLAIIMEEFRNGKIGRISLEQPPKGTEDA